MNIMFGVHLGSVLDPKLTHRLLLVSPPGGKMSRWRQKVSPVAQESFFSKWYKLNIFHERIRVLLWYPYHINHATKSYGSCTRIIIGIGKTTRLARRALRLVEWTKA